MCGSYRMETVKIRRCLGGTPALRIPFARGEILLKIEKSNPGGSIKDRAVWGMLSFTERLGRLDENTVLVEPTSGNTGIALALFGKALGIPVRLVMPDSMSLERRNLLRCYGGDVCLTPGALGMKGAVEEAENMCWENPRAVMLDQFSHPGNPWAHQVTTVPEFLGHLGGKAPSAFVAGVGTGGTLMGVSRGLRQVYPNLLVGAVEPLESPVLQGKPSGLHGIQGIGADFVPSLYAAREVDHVLAVSTEEAFEKTAWLLDTYGLFCGFSTGANLAGAMRLLSSGAVAGCVLTVAPDGGDRYLSAWPE